MNYLFILLYLLTTHLIPTDNALMRSAILPSESPELPPILTASNIPSCVCSCCVGFNCNPTISQSFAYQNCTTKTCKDECRIRDPTNCRYCMLIGRNHAYCTAISV